MTLLKSEEPHGLLIYRVRVIEHHKQNRRGALIPGGCQEIWTSASMALEQAFALRIAETRRIYEEEQSGLHSAHILTGSGRRF